MERTVILYHGNCPDGFGGSYAAWKKFGDAAEYVPLKHGSEIPENLAGAQVYLIDFSYPREKMDAILAVAASVTVLDHHEGVRDIVESIPQHVYDANRSGATIAWTYFHPETPVPVLLTYVEDGDLYRFKLPNSRALLAYVYSKSFGFEVWEELEKQLENPETLKEMIARGEIFAEHSADIVGRLVDDAKLVKFEGYTCYLSPTISMLSSDLGNRLSKKQPPLALAVQVRPDGLRVSLRSDGTADVAKIAQKYGGTGHPASSAFSLPFGAPIPWEPINENTLD